nr:hypothetical protein [Tanacetum cinerariifolium]
MATMTENVIAAGFEARPPMLEKGMYDSRKTQILLYIRGKKNGEMLINLIENGPYQILPEITIKAVDGVTDIKQWSRFVIAAKQARDLHVVNFDQLYAFLKHNEKDAIEVREMRKQFSNPVALLANTYNPPPSYTSQNTHHHSQPPEVYQPYQYYQSTTLNFVQSKNTSYNSKRPSFGQNVQGRQFHGYAGNAGMSQATGARVVNTAGDAGANQPSVIRCYNYREQQDFLADRLEENDDDDDLQLYTTTNFKAYHVDAYDSDCDDRNMAFVSTPSTSNNDDVSTVFRVSTASPQVNLEQILEDDLEEMDLKWQLALLSMRGKRFFQKTGKKIIVNGSDTAGYDKAKENRTRNQETTRRTVNVDDTSSKAMVAINRAGFDWSYMADDEAPTNMAFMAFSDLETVEEQLVHYKKNESFLNENIAVLKRDILIKDSEIAVLKNKLEKISKEKDDLDNKNEKFGNASQSLDKLVGSQITDKSKRGLGYVSYNVVPPPHTG